MWSVLIVLAGAVFLYLSGAGGAAGETDSVNEEEKMEEGTIVVRGEGRVSATPDRAHIRLGAEAVDASADEAQSKVSEQMNAVRDQLDAFVVKEDHIQTANVGVYPYHEPGQDGDEQFRAQHILEIEYSDIDNVGELLDAAAEAGANRIEQTRFALQDETEAEQKALQKAVEKTKGKAAAIAESVGKESGEVLQITEMKLR
ncbi:SIMPL domain-containing protein [Alteribacillus sp. JSM 102045]|uniref:SIMPL domain-containing protein n=1 Tax=Alteribacillus sp. JSM 102045 TaxID=1562101 RepID=UPI0035C00504